MKIAIVSDTHFGFAWETEREDDSFENAREAFQRTVDADVVVMPGDIFDHKVPKQEVLGRAIDCFNEYKAGECRVEVAPESDTDMAFDGTPVVAIHGTHERRARGFINPIELLEKIGVLCHLHGERIIFERDGEKVAVYGMSGVPERYAPQVLENLAVEPVPDAYNIFVFHQSVKDFVYTDTDHDVLTLEMLPDGFDLLVDGHIHWANLEHADAEKPLILPGSTISTQMRKVEAEQPKGFVTVDTETREVSFHPLETDRDLFYETLDVTGKNTQQIHDAIEERMDACLSSIDDAANKPLIRLILQGETDAHIKRSEIKHRYASEAIMSLSTRFSREQADTSAEQFESASKDVNTVGMELLDANLNVDDANITELFELLADNQVEDAISFIESMELEQDATEDTDADTSEPDTAEAGSTDTAAIQRSLIENNNSPPDRPD